MKKFLLLLVAILLLPGCSINYDLEITADEFYEQTSIIPDINKDEKNILDQINSQQPIYYNPSANAKIKYYKITKNEENLKLENTFTFDDFYRSSAIKQCFKEVTYQKEDNYILLRTNNKCAAFDEYPLLDALTIKIKTNLEVIVSNADNVNGNIYTWVITKDNYANKSIHLTYSLPREENIKDNDNAINSEENTAEDEKDNLKKVQYRTVMIIGSLVLLGVVIGVIIRYKSKDKG